MDIKHHLILCVFIFLCVSSCVVFDRDDRDFCLINKTPNSIYAIEGSNSKVPDLFFEKTFMFSNKKNDWKIDFIPSESKYKFLRLNRSWPSMIGDYPNKTAHIFVFDSLLYMAYFKGVPIPKNKTYIRYDFTLDELKKMNWSIVHTKDIRMLLDSSDLIQKTIIIPKQKEENKN